MKILRALLCNRNLPEDEVEDAVAKVKERKTAPGLEGRELVKVDENSRIVLAILRKIY